VPRNSTPSAEQLRIAALLGIDVRGDTEAVAAARIEDAVSPAISLGQPARPATDRQIEFGKALGLALTGDTLRVASAKIDEELFRRSAVAVESLGLKAGDRVVKRETFEFQGKEQVLEQQYVVSSIDPNSLRVWFRGGNGQGAWPTQLEKIGEPETVGDSVDETGARAPSPTASPSPS
jgi:hypothetical protein